MVKVVADVEVILSGSAGNGAGGTKALVRRRSPQYRGSRLLLGDGRAGFGPGVYASGEAGVEVPFKSRAATVPWVSAEATLRIQWFVTRVLFVELGGGPVLPLDRTR
jgi:hypothetical protein